MQVVSTAICYADTIAHTSGICSELALPKEPKPISATATEGESKKKKKSTSRRIQPSVDSLRSVDNPPIPSKPPQNPSIIAINSKRSKVAFDSLPPKARAKVEQAIEEIKQSSTVAQNFILKGKYFDAANLFVLSYSTILKPQYLYEAARAFHQSDKGVEAMILYARFRGELIDSEKTHIASEYLQGLCNQISDDPATLNATADQYQAQGKKTAKSDPIASVYAFSTNYSFERKPLYLFNIAQGFRRANKPAQAFAMYRRFLEEDPNDTLKLGRESENHLESLRVVLTLPLYKKGYFWGALAGGVAVAAALTIGLAVGLRDDRQVLQPVF